MNLRKLWHFCTIASEGSFSKAAEKLFIAQPALSRQMSELEEEVGTPLFNRLARGVSLTAAGATFLHDARQLLADAEEAKRRALLAAGGKIGTLRIGLIEFFSWHTSVVAPIRVFRESHQGVSLQLSTWEASQEIQNRILEGKLDCGFSFNRLPEDKNFDGVGVLSVEFFLAVPANSWLAARGAVQMHELKDESFVWIPREAAPIHYDRCLAFCNQAGFSPRIAQNATTESGRLSLVAAGVGCAIVTSASFLWKPEQVSVLKISDVDLKIDLELIWLAKNVSPALQNFIAATSECSKAGQPGAFRV